VLPTYLFVRRLHRGINRGGKITLITDSDVDRPPSMDTDFTDYTDVQSVTWVVLTWPLFGVAIPVV